MLDKSRRLPAIAPDDPRNLLSHEATLRIDDAFFQQGSIRSAALARIYARCENSDWDANARAEWSAAKMDGAFAVLSVECQEFMSIGKIGRALEAIMRAELEYAGNSLELSDLEKAAVWSRLYTVRAPTGLAGMRAENEVAAERQRWMSKRRPGWSLVDWRNHTGIAYETLKKYWKGITTRKTLGVRADLAKKENVALSVVPD
jgi:hypothetical protein